MLQKVLTIKIIFLFSFLSILNAQDSPLKGYVLESEHDSQYFPKQNKVTFKKPILYNKDTKAEADNATLLLSNTNNLEYVLLKNNLKVKYNNYILKGDLLKYSKKVNAVVIEHTNNNFVTIEGEDSKVITKKIEFDLEKKVAVLRGNVKYTNIAENYSFKSDVAVVTFVEINNKNSLDTIKAVGNVVVSSIKNEARGDSAYYDSKTNILEINGKTVTFKTEDGTVISTCGVIVNTLTKNNRVVPCAKQTLEKDFE